MYTFLIVMGILAYLSILFSFLSGMRFIKAKFKSHRIVGIIGFTAATVHALLMIYFNFLS